MQRKGDAVVMKLFVVILLFLKTASLSDGATTAKCPCSDPKLCKPILTNPKKEVSKATIVWQLIFAMFNVACNSHHGGVDKVLLIFKTNNTLNES